jgi:hypothetical protein
MEGQVRDSAKVDLAIGTTAIWSRNVRLYARDNVGAMTYRYTQRFQHLKIAFYQNSAAPRRV